MQPADPREGHDLRARRWPVLDGASRGRLLPQPEMRAVGEVVALHEVPQKTDHVALVEDHDVVEKIAACSLDPPFCNTVGHR